MIYLEVLAGCAIMDDREHLVGAVNVVGLEDSLGCLGNGPKVVRRQSEDGRTGAGQEDAEQTVVFVGGDGRQDLRQTRDLYEKKKKKR